MLLVLATAALLFVLQRSQTLTTSGPLLVSGEPAPASDGAAVTRSFPVEKNATYKVVMRGNVLGPVLLELQDGEGTMLSSSRLMRPMPGRPDAAYWKTVKSRVGTDGARVVLKMETGAPVSLSEVTVSRLDDSAGRRGWIASGLYAAFILAGCVIHLRRPFAQALAVGAGYFLFLLPWQLPGDFAFSSDSRFFIPTSISVIERGDWDINEFGGPDSAALFDRDYRVMKGKDGKYLNTYPAGTSLLALPLVWVGSWLHDTVPDEVERAAILAEWMARLLAAGTVALVYLLIIGLGSTTWVALGVALVFGFATPHLSLHGGGLWSHTSSAFLSALALWLCAWRGGKFAGWSALPLCLGFACRPTMAFPGMIIGGALLLRDRRRFVGFAILSAVMGFAFVAQSEMMWGKVLPPYYTNHASLQRNGPEAFLGTLLSANRGLFIHAPVLLLSVLGGVLVWRRGAGDWLYRVCAVVLIAEWALASRNLQWWGGHSYGPRILGEALVYAMPLLVPAWEWIMRREQRWRAALVCLMLLLCAWGVFVQIRGLTSRAVYDWNAKPEIDANTQRLWDWRDWQIFAKDDQPR